MIPNCGSGLDRTGRKTMLRRKSWPGHRLNWARRHDKRTIGKSTWFVRTYVSTIPPTARHWLSEKNNPTVMPDNYDFTCITIVGMGFKKLVLFFSLILTVCFRFDVSVFSCRGWPKINIVSFFFFFFWEGLRTIAPRFTTQHRTFINIIVRNESML